MSPEIAPAIDMQLETMMLVPPELRIQRAVNTAATIDEAIGNLSREAQDARSLGDAEGAEAITARMATLSPLSGRFGSVRVGNLGAGVLGMAPINGSVSEIYLSASLATHGSTEKM